MLQVQGAQAASKAWQGCARLVAVHLSCLWCAGAAPVSSHTRAQKQGARVQLVGTEQTGGSTESRTPRSQQARVLGPQGGVRPSPGNACLLSLSPPPPLVSLPL